MLLPLILVITALALMQLLEQGHDNESRKPKKG